MVVMKLSMKVVNHVDVESLDDSIVDFEVDMKMKQTNDGKGQQPYEQINRIGLLEMLLMAQDFMVRASDER